MSSSDDRVEALAMAIRQRLAGQLVDEFGPRLSAHEAMGSTGRISHKLATHVLDSPAMRDLLAEERAKAIWEYREALAGNESAEDWMTRDDYLHDLCSWATYIEEGDR